MSENQNGKQEDQSKKHGTNRSPSPNPFLSYLSSSPSNVSPRSEGSTSNSASPRSPRDFFSNGMKIPVNGASVTNSMLTAGIFKLDKNNLKKNSKCLLILKLKLRRLDLPQLTSL